MKKILAIFVFMLAMTVSAQAQDKKVSPESKGRQEAMELVEYLKLSPADLETFSRLFEIKHEKLADANLSQEKKDALPGIIEKKIAGALTGDQMEKLRSNAELLKKVTH